MKITKRSGVRPEFLPVVGYFNRRTGKAICLNHGERDLDQPPFVWTAIRQGERWEHPEHGEAPIRCHECGEWLEGAPS